MKYLLIVLTILLFSSFLTSCDKKEETLYGWEISSGLEWRTIGDKSKNPKYKGEVRREYIIFGDYIIEGQGSVTYPDGRQYVGEFKDGKENGQGTFTWTDGDKYVGEWKDGKRTGQGTFTSSGGNKYVGEFKDGKEWSGMYYNADGSIRGRFTEGKWKKL